MKLDIDGDERDVVLCRHHEPGVGQHVRSYNRRVVMMGRGVDTVARYLARTPAPARKRLREMRETIRSVVPREADEVISYRMPAFRHGRVLVWYAAFADHVSLFPGGSVLARFEDELAGFKTSKGTVQFPLERALPTALIKRIVRARVSEVQRKRSR